MSVEVQDELKYIRRVIGNGHCLSCCIEYKNGYYETYIRGSDSSGIMTSTTLYIRAEDLVILKDTLSLALPALKEEK